MSGQVVNPPDLANEVLERLYRIELAVTRFEAALDVLMRAQKERGELDDVHVLCAACSNRHNAREHRRRLANHAAGVCTRCRGELAATSSWLCDRHLEKMRAAQARYRVRKGRGMPGRRVGGTGMGVRVEHTMVPGPRL